MGMIVERVSRTIEYSYSSRTREIHDESLMDCELAYTHTIMCNLTNENYTLAGLAYDAVQADEQVPINAAIAVLKEGI